MLGEGEEWCPEGTCGRCAVGIFRHFLLLRISWWKKDEVSALTSKDCGKQWHQWSALTLPSRPRDELVKHGSLCVLSQREKILRESPYPLPFDCCKKCSDSLSGCVCQRWNDVKQSKQLRWSLCLCERECGNACKDSHVVNRLCLSRSYLSVHTASAHIFSFISPGPAYKPETWVWNGTKPLDFHFHLINDRMYMSGHHVLRRTQHSENKSHLEYTAASRVLYNLNFINSTL